MKRLAFLLAALLALPALADNARQIWELSREKRQLETKIAQVFSEKGLEEDPAYTEASEAAFKAAQDFTKARKAHPALKDLYAASDAAQSKMIKARIDGDDAAGKAAREEYTQARMEIEKAAAEIEDLKEPQQKAIDANAEVEKIRRKLLADTEDGKALVSELEALDAKIEELRASNS